MSSITRGPERITGCDVRDGVLKVTTATSQRWITVAHIVAVDVTLHRSEDRPDTVTVITTAASYMWALPDDNRLTADTILTAVPRSL